MNFDPITYNETRTAREQLAAAVVSINNNTDAAVAGVGGGKPLVFQHSANFFESRVWTAPADGVVVIRAMGAGGSGGAASTGFGVTGGGAGAWGVKTLRVKKGETISVSTGAGGAFVFTDATGITQHGIPGGDTQVTHNGVVYTAPGGIGGVCATAFNVATVLPPAPTISLTSWDFGADAVNPGIATSTSSTNRAATGGAGVNILAGPVGTTKSEDAVGNVRTGGGGTGSPSIGEVGGGAIAGGADVNGNLANQSYVDAGGGEWGISFFGGSGGRGANNLGGNGGGGAAMNVYTSRPNKTGAGGGGGGANTGNSSSGFHYAGSAFLGGGGGGLSAAAGSTPRGASGPGGDGFAHLKFYVEVQ